MNATVKDLMSPSVVTTQASATVDRTRRLLQRNGIGSVPVVDAEGHPVGTISSSDLIAKLNGNSPIRSIMTERVYTVPEYDDVNVAARIMRNHGIHHVVVTHEQKTVGIVSSFDLPRLVEDHRFAAKNAPTPSRRNAKKDRMTRSGKETTCRVGPGERRPSCTVSVRHVPSVQNGIEGLARESG